MSDKFQIKKVGKLPARYAVGRLEGDEHYHWRVTLADGREVMSEMFADRFDARRNAWTDYAHQLLESGSSVAPVATFTGYCICGASWQVRGKLSPQRQQAVRQFWKQEHSGEGHAPATAAMAARARAKAEREEVERWS